MDIDRIGDRTMELIATSSVTGDERAAIDLVTSWLEPVADNVDQWTTSMTELEGDPAYPGREVERQDVPVVAASLPGTSDGPTVVLTGHVDVVPVGDRSMWAKDPSGERIGDLIYGRGAADMKTGLVAAIEAFTFLSEAGRDFPGEVRLVAVPGEEDGGTGTLAAIRRGWTGDYVIITEPTSGDSGPDIVVAHGGALTFTIDVEGRSAHAATRLEGESALDHFMTVYRALRRCEKDLNERESDPVIARLALPYPTTVGIVSGGVWASNVMEQLTAEIRVGVTVHESIAEAEERFERTLRAELAGDTWLDAHPPRIERTGAAFGSSTVDPDNPVVRAIQGAAETLTGRRPETIGVPYGCDMALWVREGGAVTAVYGPGNVSHAHAPDEHVTLTEAGTVAKTLVDAVRRLQNLSPSGSWVH